MNRRYIIFAIFIVSLAILAWLQHDDVTSLNQPNNSPSKTPSSDTSFPLVLVDRSTATTHQRILPLYGTTDYDRRVNIKSRIKGMIDTVPSNEGTILHAGDIIATLDPENLVEQINEAEALFNQRELEYHANKTLTKQGQKSGIDLARAKTNLTQAKAQLNAQTLNLSYRTIISPFDAVIDTIDIEVGDSIKENETVIAHLIDYRSYIIRVFVPEKYIPMLHIGSAATITLSDYEPMNARIHYIGLTAEETTRTYEIKLTLIDPEANIFPAGMTASIALKLEEVLAHRIKSSSLSLNESGDIGIKHVTHDGYVAFSPVNIIQSAPDHLWVTGPPNQANIIIRGHEFVKTGSRVRSKYAGQP